MENGKRFIDADEFAKCLERMTKTAYPNLFPGLLEAIDFAKDFIPSDAVEVLHGRWHEKCVTGFNRGFSTIFICSECEKSYRIPNMNYCPNCGAKMDK